MLTSLHCEKEIYLYFWLMNHSFTQLPLCSLRCPRSDNVASCRLRLLRLHVTYLSETCHLGLFKTAWNWILMFFFCKINSQKTTNIYFSTSKKNSWLHKVCRLGWRPMSCITTLWGWICSMFTEFTKTSYIAGFKYVRLSRTSKNWQSLSFLPNTVTLYMN